MRIAELLALLGRSWSRLFLYPGGIAFLVAFVLMRGVYWGKPADHTGENLPPQALRLPFSESPLFFVSYASLVMLPWLGLALMPLPLAANIGRSIDVVMVLALLEWPRLWLAAYEYRQGRIARLAATLNSYPPCIAALGLLAIPSGSFDIRLLMQQPTPATPLLLSGVHWLGACGLLLALPALLGLGPFACPPPAAIVFRIGLLLRNVGITLLVALPFAALIPEAYSWLLPLPVCGIALLIWGMQRLGQGRAALPWARALLWLVAIEIVTAIGSAKW